MNLTLQEKIKKLRKNKNLTQSELANIAGVTKTAVYNWERGSYSPDGDNLIKEVEVTPPEAVLGCSKEISTLHGKINIKIPAGVSSGQSLRLKQLGLPKSSGYGDLNAKIKIVVPKNMSKEIIDLYKKIQALS